MIESVLTTALVVTAFAVPVVATVAILGFLARTLIGQETGSTDATVRRS